MSSAKVQSRATIWSALIGSAGVVLAAWIGVNVGRNQGQDKLEKVLEIRDREVAALKHDLATQGAALAKLQDQLQAAQGRAKTDSSVVQVNSKPGVHAEPVSEPNEKLVSNYRFELRGCRAEGSNIVCSFFITNLEGDRDFELSYQSGMIDSAGEPHQAERIFAGRELLASNADIHLVTGVPTAISFRFVGLAASVRSIALLEVKSRGFSVQWRSVQVANA